MVKTTVNKRRFLRIAVVMCLVLTLFSTSAAKEVASSNTRGQEKKDTNFLEEILKSAFPFLDTKSSQEPIWETVSKEILGFVPGRVETWVEAVLPWQEQVKEPRAAVQDVAEDSDAHQSHEDKEYEESSNPPLENSETGGDTLLDVFKGIPQDDYTTVVDSSAVAPVVANLKEQYPISALQDFNQLANLYLFDSAEVKRTPEDLNATAFMEKDFTTDLSGAEPKILIFHTHGTEGYADMPKYGILEVGDYLAQILNDKYGIATMHHKAVYDETGVTGAYGRMTKGVQPILDENPSIEIAIDMHRDGIGGDGRLVTTVNGKEIAKVMLVNGLSKLLQDNGEMAPISYLPNPNLQDNLAFSFHTKMASDLLYPGYMRQMYLKAYRYSTFMLPKSLLLEVGAEGNTLQEAKDAMEPFAEILYTVLTGNG